MSEHGSAFENIIGESVELRMRVQRGDRGAFQMLYDQIAPALYAWTRLRVQGTPASELDPQDLLQEAWLRALRGLDRYDPSQSFRSWIFGIAKNVLLQTMRNSARVRTQTPLKARGESVDFPDSVTSISSRLGKDELVQHFLAYVAGLSFEERQLVLYCGLEGYTSRQAAERLGILPDTALKRWQTLRTRLRESGTLKMAVEDEA